MGEEEVGLDALRRAARTAGRDPGPLLELATALADRFRTDEAVELLWRAFAAADAFDDKALIVRRLAGLARRQDRFGPFLEKLERTAAGPGGRRRAGAGDGPDRETALLIAEAHLAADDPAAARASLEPLLSRDPKDTTLLARLATLAESAGDYEDAVAFQKRVVDLSEESAERMRLAGMLAESGDAEAAERFYLDLLSGTTDKQERLRAIDALLKGNRGRLAVKLADAGLLRDGDDWELLIRLGIAVYRAGDLGRDELPKSVVAAVPEADTTDAEAPAEADDPGTGDSSGSVTLASRAERSAVATAAMRRVWELDLPLDDPSAKKKAEEERRRSRRAASGGRTA
ncbi:MAG: tetratricopeptide repeat protein, partial [Planctomycetota bacterium]